MENTTSPNSTESQSSTTTKTKARPLKKLKLSKEQNLTVNKVQQILQNFVSDKLVLTTNPKDTVQVEELVNDLETILHKNSIYEFDRQALKRRLKAEVCTRIYETVANQAEAKEFIQEEKTVVPYCRKKNEMTFDSEHLKEFFTNKTESLKNVLKEAITERFELLQPQASSSTFEPESLKDFLKETITAQFHSLSTTESTKPLAKLAQPVRYVLLKDLQNQQLICFLTMETCHVGVKCVPVEMTLAIHSFKECVAEFHILLSPDLSCFSLSNNQYQTFHESILRHRIMPSSFPVFQSLPNTVSPRNPLYSNIDKDQLHEFFITLKHYHTHILYYFSLVDTQIPAALQTCERFLNCRETTTFINSILDNLYDLNRTILLFPFSSFSKELQQQIKIRQQQVCCYHGELEKSFQFSPSCSYRRKGLNVHHIVTAWLNSQRIKDPRPLSQKEIEKKKAEIEYENTPGTTSLGFEKGIILYSQPPESRQRKDPRKRRGENSE